VPEIHIEEVPSLEMTNQVFPLDDKVDDMISEIKHADDAEAVQN
jgi:hypothetical protein